MPTTYDHRTEHIDKICPGWKIKIQNQLYTVRNHYLADLTDNLTHFWVTSDTTGELIDMPMTRTYYEVFVPEKS